MRLNRGKDVNYGPEWSVSVERHILELLTSVEPEEAKAIFCQIPYVLLAYAFGEVFRGASSVHVEVTETQAIVTWVSSREPK